MSSMHHNLNPSVAVLYPHFIVVVYFIWGCGENYSVCVVYVIYFIL